jgi:hypothetical protein
MASYHLLIALRGWSGRSFFGVGSELNKILVVFCNVISGLADGDEVEAVMYGFNFFAFFFSADKKDY